MAGRIALDLKQFKHVKSDDHSTTLQHNDGHMLTIAHKPLSGESKDQLKALAKMAEHSKKPMDKGESKQDAERMADGGEVKKKSSNTIMAKSAQEGIKESHKNDKEPEHGSTIVIPGKSDEKIGKIKGPKGSEKPQVFADGGDVQEDPNSQLSPMANPPQEEQQRQPAQEQQLAADPALVRKRELYNLMSGTDPDSAASIMSGDPGTGDTSSLFGKNGEAPQNFNSANWSKAEQAYSAEQVNNAAKAADLQQQAIQTNQARAAAGLQPIPVPNVPEGPQVPGSPSNMPQQKPDELPKPQMQQQPNPMQAPEDMMQSGYNAKMAGVMQQAGAQGELGRQQEQMLQDQVRAQQDAQIAYKQHYDELEKERQAHMADIKAGHIDPNQYWTGDPKTGQGGHSKIMTGIGMILSGFNPTSNPGGAMKFLEYQMNQNIEAQKQNLNSDQNLLAANLKQFGNLKDATDMTRLMQSDIVHNQLLAAAAKAQTPMAKAAALQAAGDLQMQYAPLQQQFAMRRAMMDLAHSGGGSGDPSNTAAAEQMISYARMTNPEMAKEMEARLVPGVGMAKLPIPTEDRRELIGKQNFDKMAKNYMAWAKKNSGSLSPAKINEGATMAAELQGAYRNAIKGGVYKEGEQEFIEKLIPSDPAQFAASVRTLPKLQQLIQSNNSQLNSLKHGYGLPEMQQQQSSEPVRGKDGKMYQKVPGGYIPIQQKSK